MDYWHGAGVCVNRAGVYFFCSTRVERDGDYRSSNGEYAGGGYYSQQQFLRNLDARSNMASADQPSVMDEAYKEFVMQLARGIPAESSGCKPTITSQRMVGNSKADAALLDEMINNIQFIPGDFTRAVNDSVKLIAETAPDANNLLRQYVAFASQRGSQPSE
ncbi:enterobacterial common antigen (ECA) polysaccharide chain length modulation protein [Escherichia coli]|uniref:Enterobacterial common antigen (ECA) polysaccharide chain length modulation protein n=1 Tax=Escherichia coli TaxID=562 RepID=A0A376L7I0_ECOLX|nr:enterobacterial common antigen (ECA) polysaccharide chain length modulation protein [Escherichia coli]